jgi:hypothetical protein
MGVYAFVSSLGFVLAFTVLGEFVKGPPYGLWATAGTTTTSSYALLTMNDWRGTWAGIGVAVIVSGVIAAVLVRNRFLDADHAQQQKMAAVEQTTAPSRTLLQALASPAFWTFAIGSSYYLLVSSGISLFNESILAERGFGKDVFVTILKLGVPIGLASNLACGWLATRFPLGRLLALTLGLMGLTLLAYPLIEPGSLPQVYGYAAALAVVGGGITVCFYTAWRRGFGPAHLGKIQGELAGPAGVLLTAVHLARSDRAGHGTRGLARGPSRTATPAQLRRRNRSCLRRRFALLSPSPSAPLTTSKGSSSCAASSRPT